MNRRTDDLDRRRGSTSRLAASLAMFSALAGCLTQDSGDVAGEDRPLDGESEPGGEAIVLPPGGLVDTLPSSGWTEGRFDVSGDGAAVYELPLWVPDGRRGAEPSLSLRYHSRSGNGLIGVGWSLQGLSSITPCPRTDAQDGQNQGVTFTALDAYCLDGSRLRPGQSFVDHQEFRTESDPFARVVAYRSGPAAVPSSFQVWTRDGQVLTYGGTDNAKLRALRLTGTQPEDPALVASSSRVTASWALSRIADRNGNEITIEYSSFESMPNMASVSMVPSRIQYGPDRSIEFLYELRPDPIDHFRAGGVLGGIHTWLPLRLKTIRMLGGEALLREYRLTYDDATRHITGRSRLESVAECDAGNVCLLPVHFEWSNGSREFDVIDTDVRDAGGFPLSGYTYVTGDVNGDGVDDLVYGDQNNEWKIRLNDRAGGFGQPYAANIPRALDRLERPRVRPVDYDRDGLLDLMVEVNAGDPAHPDWTKFALYRPVGGLYAPASPELDPLRTGEVGGSSGVHLGYFAGLTGSGLADYLAPRFDTDSRLRWRYRRNSPLDSSMHLTDLYTGYAGGVIPPIRAVDTDGDGLTELVVADPVGQRYEKIEYAGDALGPDRALVKSTENLNLPFARLPENGSRANLHFADVNGDGLEDAIYPFSGLTVQLNSGAGFSHLIAGPTDYVDPETVTDPDHRGVRIFDFDNDGADDVMVFHPGSPDGPGDAAHGIQLYVWRNQHFVRVSEVSRAMPALLIRDGIQLLDFDRDGVTDVSYVEGQGTSSNFLRVLRRRGGIPDLLTRVVVDNLGPRVEVDYTNLANVDVHRPGQCTYPLVCPRRGGVLVAAHRLANGVDRERPWHEYRHTYRAARTDLSGRGWLGFEEHAVVDQENDATTTMYFDNTTSQTTQLADGREATLYPFAHRARVVDYKVFTEGAEGYQRTITFNRRVHPWAAPNTPGTYFVELTSQVDFDQELGSRAQGLHLRTSQFQYDDFGNPIRSDRFVLGGQGHHEVLSYRNDTANWLIGLLEDRTATSCTENEGPCETRHSAFHYDASGNIDEIHVEPDHTELHLETAVGYGSFGNVTSITTSDDGGQSRGLTITYDDLALYPRTMTNALDHLVEVTIDPGLGVPLSSVDPNRVIPATMKYDRFGRVREVNYADGYFERFLSFGPLARFTVAPDGAGGTITAEVIAWDALGRAREHSTAAFGGGLSTTRFTYDRRGRLATASRPFLSGSGETIDSTTRTYDARDRLRSVVEPDGATVSFDYVGLETHTHDANGNHSYMAERGDGLIESRYEDDPDSDGWLRTRFEYLPFGLLGRVVAADGTIQTMAYDLRGRRVSLDDPSTGLTESIYDAFGELASETDANGATTDYAYDLLGRIRKVTSPDGEATYKWDTATKGIGKPVNAISADGVGINYRYDVIGRPSSTLWNVEGTSYELACSYDSIGRLASVKYPVIPGTQGERLQIAYAYNPSGHLAEIKDTSGTAPPYWTAEDRNAAGQLTRERYRNGVVTAYQYQPATGLLESIQATGPAGAPLVLLTYGYDPNRNVTGRLDAVNSRTDLYLYDPLDRLVTWSAYNPQSALLATYDYDAVGNLRSENVLADAELSATYRYGENGAAPHALTSRNGARYQYDAAGRQISGPNRTIEYNDLGLPMVLTWGIGQGVPKVTKFAYDPLGSRVLKRDDVQTIFYVGGLFERRTPAGTGGSEAHNLHNILVDGRTVAQVLWTQSVSGGPVTGTRVHYLHADLQGSTVAVSNDAGRPMLADQPPDDKTVGTESLDFGHLFYDPWGRRIDASYAPLGHNRSGGPRQGYTGHEHEDEYGLINMRGRIYDPEARRFLTPDPFVAAPLFSQSYSRYSYVASNPASLIDPSGFTETGPQPKKTEDEGETQPTPESTPPAEAPPSAPPPSPEAPPAGADTPSNAGKTWGFNTSGGWPSLGHPAQGNPNGVERDPSSDDNTTTDGGTPGAAGGLFSSPKDDPNNRNLGPIAPDKILPGHCGGSHPPAGNHCVGITLGPDGNWYWVWQKNAHKVPLMPGPWNGPLNIMVDPDTAKAFDGLMIVASYVLAGVGAVRLGLARTFTAEGAAAEGSGQIARSLGAAAAPKPASALKRVSDAFLKQRGFDAHSLKAGLAGRPSRFDIFMDRAGNLFAKGKGLADDTAEWLGHIDDNL